MKKYLLMVMVLGLAAASGNLFAESKFHLGFGLGFGFSGDFGSGSAEAGEVGVLGNKISVDYTSSGSSPYFGAFFDVTYAELGFAFGFSQNTFQGSTSITLLGVTTPTLLSFTTTKDTTYLGFSVLLKWPVDLEQVTLFPLLGFEFLKVKYLPYSSLSSENSEDFQHTYWSIDLGMGGDFFLTKKKHLFIRTSFLYGLVIDPNGNPWNAPAPSTWTGESVAMDKNGFSHLTAKFALGWRFF